MLLFGSARRHDLRISYHNVAMCSIIDSIIHCIIVLQVLLVAPPMATRMWRRRLMMPLTRECWRWWISRRKKLIQSRARKAKGSGTSRSGTGHGAGNILAHLYEFEHCDFYVMTWNMLWLLCVGTWASIFCDCFICDKAAMLAVSVFLGAPIQVGSLWRLVPGRLVGMTTKHNNECAT